MVKEKQIIIMNIGNFKPYEVFGCLKDVSNQYYGLKNSSSNIKDFQHNVFDAKVKVAETDDEIKFILERSN